MKSEYERSVREYDGAEVVWRRDQARPDEPFGPWYPVRVRPAAPAQVGSFEEFLISEIEQ